MIAAVALRQIRLVMLVLIAASARPIDVHKHSLVDHLEAGKHLFVMYSNNEFDHPDAAHKEEFEAWKQLGEFYKDDDKVLIGFVNCYHDVKDIQLCKQHQIHGYPWLKHYKGDEWVKPPDGHYHQSYGGKRDFEALKEFVEGYLRMPKGHPKGQWELNTGVPKEKPKEEL